MSGIIFIRYAQGSLFWTYKTRLTPHLLIKASEERAVISMCVKGMDVAHVSMIWCFVDGLIFLFFI